MTYLNLLRYGQIVALMAVLSPVIAQETTFTQFYNLRTALNPAYVSVPNGVEMTAGYRRQWPSLQQGLHGAFAGVAMRHCGTPLGYGLSLSQVGEDVFGYRIREATFQTGAFVNTSHKSSLHLGLQATIGSRGVNASRQVFTGQLDPVFGIVRDNSAFVSVEHNSLTTFDIGGGLVWRGEYGVGRFKGPISAGLSVQHLGGSRDVSLQNIETTLHPRWIAHVSMAVPVSEEFRKLTALYITPMIRIDVQGQQRQTFAGCIIQLQSTYLSVVYIHARNPVNVTNTNALSISPGFEFPTSRHTRITLGYSFDMPLSGLGATSTGGTHELSMRINFDNVCIFGSQGYGRKKKGWFSTSTNKRKAKCYQFGNKGFLGFLN